MLAVRKKLRPADLRLFSRGFGLNGDDGSSPGRRDALDRIVAGLPSKRMTPSGLQDPSAPVGASQIFCGGPPEMSTFFSLPSAKKPRNRLSGDQNGRVVPSVPARGCATSALSGRTQMRLFPEESVALNAR